MIHLGDITKIHGCTLICGDCPVYEQCGRKSRKHGGATTEDCFNRLFEWLKAPVEESKE